MRPPEFQSDLRLWLDTASRKIFVNGRTSDGETATRHIRKHNASADYC